MALVGVGRQYFHVFVRVSGKEPNLYIHFSRVKAAEPIDTSDYFIIKKEYTNLPTAIIEEVQLTQKDKETIKATLIPRIAGMIGKWGIKPKNTYIKFT